MDNNLPQVCSTNKSKSKSIIIGESSMEESESECIHKSINKERNTMNEADHEVPFVWGNTFVKKMIYFNIFEY